MTFFENAIRALERLGVADVILPFMLIFAVSYMALQKVPVLSNNKRVPMVIALVLAFSVIFPHVTGNYSYHYGNDVVEIINNSLPNVGLLLVMILSVLLVVGALGFDFEDFGGSALGGALAIIALLLVSGIFGESAGWFDNFYLLDYFGPDAQALIVMGAICAIFIMMITGEGGSGNWGDTIERWLTRLTKLKNK